MKTKGGFTQFQLNYQNLCESSQQQQQINNNNMITNTLIASAIGTNSSLTGAKQQQQQQSSINNNNQTNYESHNSNKFHLSLPSSAMLHHHTIAAPPTSSSYISLRSTVPFNKLTQNDEFSFSKPSGSNPHNHEITQILPFLYLGSENDALCEEKINVSDEKQKNKQSHVIVIFYFFSRDLI